jgi:hypothetical protein
MIPLLGGFMNRYEVLSVDGLWFVLDVQQDIFIGAHGTVSDGFLTRFEAVAVRCVLIKR